MREKGNVSLEEIKRFTNNFSGMRKLDSTKVERGTVYVLDIFDDGKKSKSVLVVAPNTKIREHQHITDSEKYVMCNHSTFREMKEEVCPIGEWHFLENTSATEWLIVRSEKTKADV